MTYTIEYFADNDSMGGASDFACDAYRKWAKARIQEAYPDHEVSVSARASLRSVITDDEENRDEIERFCARLWDECTWEDLA